MLENVLTLEGMLGPRDILIKDFYVCRLVGTCESQDTLYVVLEHHPALLKDVLLQSRSLHHSPNPKTTRFCSFSETDVFQFVIGVAQGMDFLASRKVTIIKSLILLLILILKCFHFVS